MKTRIESDLIGELEIPGEAYYGVQTQRAMENFNISTSKLRNHREFISALAAVKIAAAQANNELDLINDELTEAIVEAAKDVICACCLRDQERDLMKSIFPDCSRDRRSRRAKLIRLFPRW